MNKHLLLLLSFITASAAQAQGSQSEEFPCLMDVEIAFSIPYDQTEKYFRINVYNESHPGTYEYHWNPSWSPLSTDDHPGSTRECVW